jgi:hypothetical protein
MQMHSGGSCLPAVDIHDDFFRFGGDSINAAELIAVARNHRVDQCHDLYEAHSVAAC